MPTTYFSDMPISSETIQEATKLAVKAGLSSVKLDYDSTIIEDSCGITIEKKGLEPIYEIETHRIQYVRLIGDKLISVGLNKRESHL